MVHVSRDMLVVSIFHTIRKVLHEEMRLCLRELDACFGASLSLARCRLCMQGLPATQALIRYLNLLQLMRWNDSDVHAVCSYAGDVLSARFASSARGRATVSLSNILTAFENVQQRLEYANDESYVETVRECVRCVREYIGRHRVSKHSGKKKAAHE